MIAVGLVALLIWGAKMGTFSYVYYRRAMYFELEERGWREAATEGRFKVDFCLQFVDYFARLSRKYRRGMWCPWLPIAPDPHAPGFDQWVEQERRVKEVGLDPSNRGLPPS
jgi:hypothetical protein